MIDLLTELDIPDRSGVPRDEHGRPRVLIEEWLPIKELGVESVRERASPLALPPISFLHTWWARRPLAACSGVIVASLLPIWTPGLAESLSDPRVETEERYQAWFLHLVGIWGDPVAAREAINQAKLEGRRLEGNGYGYRQAFKNSPSPSDLQLLHRLLAWCWGGIPEVLDPTAGGGSIPYTAVRFGLPSHANDLNGVAASVLRAGIETPSVIEPQVLSKEISYWGDRLVQACATRLEPYFPKSRDEEILAYLYVRAVPCPRTGKLTPLAPNWWLSKPDQVAVRPRTERDGSELDAVEFEVVQVDSSSSFDPDAGTQSRGAGTSVWDGLPIDGDYIKSIASGQGFESIPYAVAYRKLIPGSKKKERGYRSPSEDDRRAVEAARRLVDESLSDWIARGLVPEESVPEGNKTSEALRYGMSKWRDMFSPRQLLVHAVFVDEWRNVREELRSEVDDWHADLVAAQLALLQGKALNYNSELSFWNAHRALMNPVFQRHDFGFAWTFGEFDGSRQLFPWALKQVEKATRELGELLRPGSEPTPVAGSQPISAGKPSDLFVKVPAQSIVTVGSAAALDRPAKSTALVCIDPPYYDNVMYAELSDFFGVWEQHTIGTIWPDLLPGGLADVASEAVANPARFAHTGKRRSELATLDYEAKMQAIFTESHRVLRDDGVLTVMFTHKKAEAWDTLGMALMEAGFQIEASWPISTESEQSLHIAKKNAAASTIMLVCRKRPTGSSGGVFFEDLVPAIRSAAQKAVKQFADDGIDGVDLLLSSYGPVLSVISAQWPVLSSEADESGNARRLRPEEALDIAREELLAAERRALVGKDIQFDPPTDFVLFSWNTFQAAEFPYDDARKLAVACAGSDIDDLVKSGIASKKTGTVTLRSPKERMKQTVETKTLDPKAGTMIDRLWAILAIAESSGLAAAKAAMDRASMTTDPKFVALVQAAVNAIPRTKKKGEFTRPEAEWLDNVASTYLSGTVEIPEEPESGRLFDVD